VSVWREVGDRVFVRHYEFLDQNIGAVVGDDGVLIVDTRTTHRQADEVLADLRIITSRPVVRVVDTHMHYDHTFGNARFRPAELWGHERCAERMREDGERARASLVERFPDLADDIRRVEIAPPDHTFRDRATVSWPGRTVELRHLGRGHTDNDIVVVVPGSRSDGDGGVVFAGDLLENGAPPWFGDAYPMDWPETASRIVALAGGVIVPGHGDVGDRRFAAAQAEDLAAVASLAADVHADELTLQEAASAGPFPPDTMSEALGRALAQLRGELE
jgi:glyoxylase-like metal-dependent hydrolase (beta-lactamase superfamily II)